MSCSTIKPLLIQRDQPKNLNCPPKALEICEPLDWVDSLIDIDFKSSASTWIQQYRICQVKQEELRNCILNYEK